MATVKAGKAPPREGVPSLRGRQLAAVRAIAATPGGLRAQAYPSVMPLLHTLGVAELRPLRAGVSESRWFLTPLGRRAATLHGRDEP